jgi:hypothetical protein
MVLLEDVCQEETTVRWPLQKSHHLPLLINPIGGGALSCVAQSNLECDANVIERGKSLCRAKAPGGGLFDGANIIQSLSQAKVN